MVNNWFKEQTWADVDRERSSDSTQQIAEVRENEARWTQQVSDDKARKKPESETDE
ncbi:hypothetical protein MOQ72_34165 [Saccharopolyspora sp. K220]|uniref:hypothetical protein n=1 Tax=Saccharopolyspora soli TaxID=2926618 RepID=UPI001F55C29F|nr:hypothetical protein [Saccharopolyspora soli]MCI2422485.1 hypothetical protein [Saccharopolyspora soli]